MGDVQQWGRASGWDEWAESMMGLLSLLLEAKKEGVRAPTPGHSVEASQITLGSRSWE